MFGALMFGGNKGGTMGVVKAVSLYIDPRTQNPIPVGFLSNGDGTFAQKVQCGGGGGGADKIVNLYIDPATQTPIPVRFVDNGDGTWAQKVRLGS